MKHCPFCGAPEAEPYRWPDTEPAFECATIVNNGGDEERTRTHQCYLNQIRQLQTGETDYAQGFRDGASAMGNIVLEAVHNENDYSLTHPPMRRPGTRYEDTHKSD